jgi:hypothetical protein
MFGDSCMTKAQIQPGRYAFLNFIKIISKQSKKNTYLFSFEKKKKKFVKTQFGFNFFLDFLRNIQYQEIFNEFKGSQIIELLYVKKKTSKLFNLFLFICNENISFESNYI